MKASVLIAVLLLLALIWRLWTAWPEKADSVAPSVASTEKATIDVAAVQALALFGNQQRDAAQTAAMPDSTELELNLSGVVVGKEPGASLAFIASKGKQHAYKVGDVLPAGVDATLLKIASDHVVLRHNGLEQSLWLFNGKGSAGADTTTVRKNARVNEALAAGKVQATAMLQAAPQQIKQTAGRLAEIFTVQAAIANATLQGYRVAPGAKIKEFIQLGFKDGDIITSANGIALNDMANLPELYNLMNRPADVSFSLLRDGKPVSLQVTLTP